MKVIARYESKSGKHWIDITRNDSGDGLTTYGYRSVSAGGSGFRFTSDSEAVQWFERNHVTWTQPDANKTPMRQVARNYTEVQS